MIKYICMSDLHAGALTSLLLDVPLADRHLSPNQLKARVDPKRPSPVTESFARALSEFLGADKPKLVLLGDVLDLQFSDRTYAIQNASSFLNTIAAACQFDDEAIVTAGNHDHSLWTDARLGIEGANSLSSDFDPTTLDATPAFDATPAAQSRLMVGLLKQAGFKSVDFRYPSIGFHKDDRAVLLHHGHFAEPAYRLISSLIDFSKRHPRKTLSAAQVSAENAGWIDFFWASIADTGYGRDSNEVYQKLLTSEGYRHLSGLLSKKIAEALRESLPLSGNLTVQEITRIAVQVGLDLTLGKYRDTERAHVTRAMSPHGFDDLRWFLEGPALGQIAEKFSAPPQDTTFIFGHTHKPFAERVIAAGYPRPVKTYNTGGWLLNGPRLDTAEGASIVVMDDDLNVASVRLFNTPTNGEAAPVRIEALRDGDVGSEAFVAELDARLASSSKEWEAFRQVVGQAFVDRQKTILDLTRHEEHVA